MKLCMLVGHYTAHVLLWVHPRGNDSIWQFARVKGHIWTRFKGAFHDLVYNSNTIRRIRMKLCMLACHYTAHVLVWVHPRGNDSNWHFARAKGQT